MGEFNKALDERIERKLQNLHTAAIGRLTKNHYDEEDNWIGCDVKIDDYPLLQKINATTICSEGSTVLVIFLEKPRYPEGKRRHDLTDGVVIGELVK